MFRSPEERRERAVRAAVAAAREHGLDPTSPAVLQDWNNTIVRLAPLPLVAKVSTSPLADGSRSLAREVDVAAHLAARGAPVIPPATLLPPGPHLVEGLVLTMWEYCAGHPVGETDGESAGRALAAVHAAFLDYPKELPSFDVQTDEVGRLLKGRGTLPALTRTDREFLREQHAVIADALALQRFEERPLHGEAHLGNVLRAADGLRWFDFESACRGPVEWDVTTLPEHGRGAYEVDGELLRLLGRARSLCVAAWCWVQPDRAPEVAQAARVHLRLLRDAAAS
ncbi:MAG: aminoglycoside phosphotransferase family protein [Actinobacteria bacterium]|nr:aminoglycoside phosphotransferase family protein [Actinomycetota bacterium]